MAQRIKSKSGWELSKSYDIGVAYTFRDLLKDNPVRRRFFRQWLAKFDHENIKNYYDYATKRSQKKGDLAPTEVHYDQVQRMVFSANLPVKVENELFYHLDYHLNRENNSIDFLRLKEFFAFCGIDGTYDLEKGVHALMTYDPPFAVESLNVEKWDAESIQKNREMLARMMSEPGEVPDNREVINELTLQHNILWKERFLESDLSEKLISLASKVVEGQGKDTESVMRAIETAKARNIDMDAHDDELNAFNDAFNATSESQQILMQIEALKNDEATKLAAALDKYASDSFIANPERFAEYDKNLSHHGFDWDHDHNTAMNDIKAWGKKFIGHNGPESCSNEEPTAEELPRMRPGLVNKKLYSKARFAMLMAEFENNEWPKVRTRYCAIKDWILRDYTMSPINKGELAKARKEDIPVLFAEALQAELGDGLLTKLQFPIRIERLNDGTGNCKLVINNEDVEVFHPGEILPELSSEQKIEADALVAPRVESGPAENVLDFKIHSPGMDVVDLPEIEGGLESGKGGKGKRKQAKPAVATPAMSAEDELRQQRARSARQEQYNREQAAADMRNHMAKDYHRRQQKAPHAGMKAPGKAMQQGGYPNSPRMPGMGMGMGGHMPFMIGLPEMKNPFRKDALAATKKDLGTIEAANAAGLDGAPTDFDNLKKSLDGVKDEVNAIAKEKDKGAFQDRLHAIRKEMKKAMEMFMRNPAASDLAKQCRKMAANIGKAVMDILNALQNLFKPGSGAAPANA